MIVTRMRSRIRVTLIVIPVLASWLSLDNSGQVSAREGVRLEPLLTVARTGRQYQPATREELARCEELFLQSFRDARQPGLAEAWWQLGFRFEQLAGDDVEMWVLAERPGKKRGWGCYVICAGREPGLVLQAPHSYADQYTENVALRLFADGAFAAAAWNTVPRKIVDVAHTAEHPFTAFTRALIRVHPMATVLQVHGFSQDKRRTVAGSTADLIISNGTRAPDRSIRRLVVRLQAELPYAQVQLFPTEVSELGATRNVQGEVLRQAGSPRFVHLEMSQDLRLRLVNDPQARREFLKNLADFVD